jgi:phosphatidylglycerophosphatase A
MKRLTTFIATGAYSGYFPIFPGTAGTIPAWILAWFLFKNPYAMLAAAVVTTAVSVWSAGEAEKAFGHDSRKIVIDEWAGMFISLLFLPVRLDVFVAAFVFFRFYDVIKPYPADRCERLPGGWGVTFDDVFAAVYVNLTCQAGVIVMRHLHWFGF